MSDTENEVKVAAILRGKLAKAFQQETRKTLAANSAITRAAIKEYLAARGYDVEDGDDISWGGSRKKEDDLGQLEPAVAGISLRQAGAVR